MGAIFHQQSFCSLKFINWDLPLNVLKTMAKEANNPVTMGDPNC